MKCSLEEIYDRQLRLWGYEGQKCLNNTTMCFLGSDALAAEIAKNLSLTGIGHIIFIDDAIVTEIDIKENFFTLPEDIGKPRCESIKSSIQELNQFIKVDSINAPISDIDKLDSILSPHSFVVTTSNQGNSFLNRLSIKCRDNKWTQIHVQMNGFFGEIAIDPGTHVSIEGFVSDPEHYDLRLTNPFPAISEYLDAHSLQSLSPDQLSKAPFIFILWEVQKKLGISLPANAPFSQIKETALKVRDEVNLLKQKYSQIDKEIFDQMENDQLYYEIARPYVIPDIVKEAFQKLDIMESQSLFDDNEYWPPIRAVYEFYKRHGFLPEYGILKDFECNPFIYKEIKEIYKTKSLEDEKEVSQIISEMNHGLKVDPEILHRVILSVNRLSVFIYQPLSVTLGNNIIIGESDDESTKQQAIVRKLFWASREFKNRFGRDPGSVISDWKQDVAVLRDILGPVNNIDESIVMKFTKEFCVKKGLIITSIAGSLAGMASQEIIKLASHNSTPLNTGIKVINWV